MPMSWEGEEPNGSGWTRREWAKLAMAAGAASSIAALAGTVSGQLLPPPMKFEGESASRCITRNGPRRRGRTQGKVGSSA